MRLSFAAVLVVVLGAGCAGSPAPPAARSSTRTAPPHQVVAAAPLRPVPPSECEGARACVDTRTRTAWLLRGRVVVAGPLPVSTGSAGHPTPRGTFAVAWKDEVHTSSSYGIPMPYSVFFAPGGIAFHEGDVRTESHGCVHLHHADAALVFATLARGDAVRVL